MAKTTYKTDSYPYQVYTALLDGSFINTDGALLNTPIEIRVYN